MDAVEEGAPMRLSRGIGSGGVSRARKGEGWGQRKLLFGAHTSRIYACTVIYICVQYSENEYFVSLLSPVGMWFTFLNDTTRITFIFTWNSHTSQQNRRTDGRIEGTNSSTFYRVLFFLLCVCVSVRAYALV